MNGFIKYSLPATFGFLAIPLVFRDIWDHTAVEYLFSILFRIKHPVKIEY